MADINQVITLGIGTPADISHFILFGLNTGISGTVYTNLYNRLFGSATLDTRQFGTADLHERGFGSATLEEKP